MNTRPLMIEVPNGTHVKWIDDNGVTHFGQTSRTFMGPKNYICRRADGSEAIVPAMKLELIEDPNSKRPHPLTDGGGVVSAALGSSSVEGPGATTDVDHTDNQDPGDESAPTTDVVAPVEPTLEVPAPAATEAPTAEVPIEAAPLEDAAPVVEAPVAPAVTDAAPTPDTNETPAQ